LTLDGAGLKQAQRKRDESRRAEIARLMDIARAQGVKMQAIRAEKAKKSKEMLGNVPGVSKDAKERRKLLIKASGGMMARNPFSGANSGAGPSRRGSVTAGDSIGGDGEVRRRGGRLRAVIQARMSQIRTGINLLSRSGKGMDRVYVCAENRRGVRSHWTDGDLELAFGEEEVMMPGGIAVGLGEVYVSDVWRHCVHRFGILDPRPKTLNPKP